MGIISSRFEDGGSLLEPASNSLKAFLRGRSAYTGRNITEESALESAVVFACLRILADTLSMLPRHVFEINESGKRAETRQHPAAWLIGSEPNPHMAACSWVDAIQGHVAGWGNGYSEIIRNKKGEIKEIWPLLPNATRPYIKDGQLRYQTTIGGKTFGLRSDEVLHIKGFGFSGYLGYSVIQYAKQAIAIGLAAEEFSGKWFGQGTIGGYLIKTPSKLTKEGRANLREYMQEESSGLDNAHRFRILQEGASLEAIGLPPEDAQLIQQRNIQGHEIARFFRIQLHKLQYLENATYSNIEHQAIEFVTDTILPWVVRWEQELNRRLFVGDERGRFYVKFNLGALFRGDNVSRGKFFQLACGGPWLTVDEVRALEDLDQIEGGGILRSPVNMQKQGMLEEGGEENE